MKIRAIGQRLQGFVLIEVLVSLFVLGVGIVGIQRLILFGFQLTNLTQEEALVSEVLQEKLDVLRMYTWEQLSDDKFVPKQFEVGIEGLQDPKGKIIVTPAGIGESYKTELLEVEVVITWISNGVERRREMRTWIARNGLNSYIQNKG